MSPTFLLEVKICVEAFKLYTVYLQTTAVVQEQCNDKKVYIKIIYKY